MADYIDREKTEEAIQSLTIVDATVAAYAEAVLFILRRQPSADVEPVVHARWELSQRIAGGARWECSLCGREIETNMLKKLHRFPYCHCGAKMDMNKEGE